MLEREGLYGVKTLAFGSEFLARGWKQVTRATIPNISSDYSKTHKVGCLSFLRLCTFVQIGEDRDLTVAIVGWWQQRHWRSEMLVVIWKKILH